MKRPGRGHRGKTSARFIARPRLLETAAKGLADDRIVEYDRGQHGSWLCASYRNVSVVRGRAMPMTAVGLLTGRRPTRPDGELPGHARRGSTTRACCTAQPAASGESLILRGLATLRKLLQEGQPAPSVRRAMPMKRGGTLDTGRRVAYHIYTACIYNTRRVSTLSWEWWEP